MQEKGFESGGLWLRCVNTDGGGAGHLGRRREPEWSPRMPGPEGDLGRQASGCLGWGDLPFQEKQTSRRDSECVGILGGD